MGQEKHSLVSGEKMGQKPSNEDAATFSLKRLMPGQTPNNVYVWRQNLSVNCWVWYYVVQSIIFASSGQVSWLCLVPASCPLPAFSLGGRIRTKQRFGAVLVPNANHSTIWASTKRVYSISARPNTQLWLFFGRSCTYLFLQVFNAIAWPKICTLLQT